jgi:hypothetical protein
MKTKKKFKLAWPEIIFIAGIFIVISSFLLFYLIDLHNFLGLRDYLFSLNKESFHFFYQPYFFQHWGRNGGIAEIIQFILLASSSIVSAFIASYQQTKSRKKYIFWLLMTIAFALMLIEDAGEIRHTLRSYIQAYFGEIHQGAIGTFSEFIYFFLLASIPVCALLCYGKFLMRYNKTRIYMVIGFSFYFLAASLSHLGTFVSGLFTEINKNFYDLIGEEFCNFCLKIGDTGLAIIWKQNINTKNYISHFLMDSLIEENIELVGVSAFLAACVSFLIIQNKERNNKKNNI